jgi:hypothetical protein
MPIFAGFLPENRHKNCILAPAPAPAMPVFVAESVRILLGSHMQNSRATALRYVIKLAKPDKYDGSKKIRQ